MTIRAEVVQTELSLVERGDVGWPLPPEIPSCREPDWRSLFERERARAEAAESRCEELRWAEVDTRARAGSLKWRHDTCRRKLQAALEEAKEVRLAAKDALSLKAEVERLEKLLSEAGVEPCKRSTVMSLRMEVVRLRKAAPASEARQVRTVLEGSRSRKDSIKTLRKEMGRRDKEVARLEDRLARESQASETRKETIRWQGDEVIRLHAESRRLRDQAEVVKSLSGEVYRLGVALGGRRHREGTTEDPVAARDRGGAVEVAVARGRGTAQGPGEFAAPEEGDQVPVERERAAAQDASQVGDPPGAAGGRTCEASRHRSGVVEEAVRAQERAAGEAAL